MILNIYPVSIKLKYYSLSITYLIKIKTFHTNILYGFILFAFADISKSINATCKKL